MKFKEIIDISWPIKPGMSSYKNGNEVAFIPTATFEAHNYRKSNITLSTHSGTHVDAPSHFQKDGKSIESVALDSLIGPCRVLDLTSCAETITAHDLENHSIAEGEIILFKTKNSTLEPDAPFNPPFVYLEKSGAQFLAQKKIKACGIDYLGIERNQPDHETHVILFDHSIAIIEGLRLEHVAPGHYFLCCLPLNIETLEASPARAILLT